jgi:3-hydroxyisobutyrate dehydrogenase-like beta-hydroxyacid dehydrogenase
MATRIARAGFDVTAVEPSAAQREATAVAGIGAVVESIDMAPHTVLVIVMVATPEQLAQVVGTALTQPDQRGRTWVIMSTVGPASATEQAARLTAAGARVVDAPVTGGVAGARAGTLRIFTSGAPRAVAAARAVLEACGVVELVGDSVGLGQSIKVVNQHLCSVHLVAAAEALALSRALGLDPKRVFELVAPGAGGSWMLGDRGPRMLAEDDVEVTSTIGIFVKDSGLVAEAAETAGAAVPVLLAARAKFVEASDAGLVRDDDSRVIRVY